MPESVARGTVERARFFLDQAFAIGAADRSTFQHFLEAAIVFARSVTFHVQKQYAHADGFADWYAGWQERLKGDALANFFLVQRNYVLKQGPLRVGKHVEVHLQATVTLTDSVSVKVFRGQPWYHRSPKILIEDAVYPIREMFRTWRQERSRRRVARSTTEGSSTGVAVTENLHFAEEPWSQRPALQLMHEYLSTLNRLVTEAEEKFGIGDPEAA